MSRYLLFVLLLVFIISCDQSVQSKLEIAPMSSTESNPKSSVELKMLTNLYESNQEILSISEVGFQNVKDIPTLKFILKIQKEHRNRKAILKRVSEKKLVILNPTLAEFQINDEEIDSSSVKEYILTELEIQLQLQQKQFEVLEEASNSSDLKNLAIQGKNQIKENLASLKHMKNS